MHRNVKCLRILPIENSGLLGLDSGLDKTNHSIQLRSIIFKPLPLTPSVFPVELRLSFTRRTAWSTRK
jgi:hypothetical protein